MTPTPVNSRIFERNLYYSARLLAQVSQNLLFAGLFVSAGTSSHAAIGLSSIFAAMLVPAVLFGFAGGAVADRLGPARGFALGAFLRFAVVAAALLFMRGSEMAWVVAFAYSAASQVFTPAEMALVRSVRDDHFGRVHSFLVALQYGGQGLGLAVAAPALWWLGGPTAVVAGSAVGFLGLTVLCSFLAVRLSHVTHAPVDLHAFSFRDTVSFFRRRAIARDAVTALSVKVLVAQGVIVALPLYLSHDIGLGHSAIAYLIAPGAVGTALGLIWAAPSVTAERAGWFMRAGIAGMAVGLFALAALDYTLVAVYEYTPLSAFVHFDLSLNATFVVALPVSFLIGLSVAIAMVAGRVALTETAPLSQQARVFAVQNTLTETLVVAPLMLMGIGTQFAGARPALAVLGLIATAALLLIAHPRFRPAPELEPEQVPVPAG